MDGDKGRFRFSTGIVHFFDAPAIAGYMIFPDVFSVGNGIAVPFLRFVRKSDGYVNT
ncbi:hypothetical protein [Oxalobacter formigenes]|uniref:hypothetical protein n=1 Tax=Oxalobacter formigenes TaxID=847 RepID=UPI000313B462|nr:hypothetical protein [Oxalobacter formigenes]MCZ4063738.1 hypothetical protein [Oxalobacter formigenes]WAW00909.1 hypothetical protein NB644_08130 [Oxalobacter formigenes]WAW03239.1 hypothetical protein NB642_08910 [Oxalobacter formigenes]WAW06322.1 hypothetical protein NB639_02635 [Oxalobacter formigenes]WAW07293.1 hypothetical protein NB638_07055 [Oxalobacter formigenes]